MNDYLEVGDTVHFASTFGDQADDHGTVTAIDQRDPGRCEVTWQSSKPPVTLEYRDLPNRLANGVHLIRKGGKA